MLEQILNHPDLYKYASIPFIAAFIGWGTNWLAIKLMFHPLEFVGYKPLYLGWQGIIPSRAEKMARIVVDKTLNNLVALDEIFEALDNDLDNLDGFCGIITDGRKLRLGSFDD